MPAVVPVTKATRARAIISTFLVSLAQFIFSQKVIVSSIGGKARQTSVQFMAPTSDMNRSKLVVTRATSTAETNCNKVRLDLQLFFVPVTTRMATLMPTSEAILFLGHEIFL